MPRIINPYRMALAVRDNKVFQIEFWIYALIFVVFFVIPITSDFLMLLITQKTFFSHVQTVNISVQYGIQILRFSQLYLALVIAYVINKKGDAAHFWYRFISIYISVFIITLFVPIIISLLYSKIFSPALLSDISHISWDYVIFSAIYMVVFIILMVKYMRIASGKKDLMESPPIVAKTPAPNL